MSPLQPLHTGQLRHMRPRFLLQLLQLLHPP